MAWGTFAYRGNTSEKTSDTSIAISPTANLLVDEIIFVFCETDNSATTQGETTNHSLADSKGNTWTKLIEFTRTAGSANDGVTASLWATKVTTQINTTDSITLTLASAVTAKLIQLQKTTVAAGKTFSFVNKASAGANSTSPSVTLSGLTSAEYLWFALYGWEGVAGDASTYDADYTAFGASGTSGGSAVSNVADESGYRIFTGTSDTFAPTLGNARDWAACLVAVEEYTPGIVVTPTPVSLITTSVAPTVVFGSLSIAPTAAFKLDASFAPSVVLGSLSVVPNAAEFVATTPLPGIGFSPVAPASLVTEKVNPLVVLGSLSVQPTAGDAVMASLAPTVVLGSISFTPSAAEQVFSTPLPGIAFSPVSAASAIFESLAPSVVLSSLSITPTAASQVLTNAPVGLAFTTVPSFFVAASFNPTVVLGSIAVTPAVAFLIWEKADPSVIEGSGLSITPQPAFLVAASLAPTVVLGSLIVAPSAGFLIAERVNPAVVLGSLLLAPSAVSLVEESFGPSVVLGSLQLTPSASQAIFASFPPTTVLGSLSLQPSPGFLVASGLDPLAILGSLLIAPSSSALQWSTFLQTALEVEPSGPASLVLQALIHQVLGGEKRFDIPLTAGGITLLEKRERPL